MLLLPHRMKILFYFIFFYWNFVKLPFDFVIKNITWRRRGCVSFIACWSLCFHIAPANFPVSRKRQTHRTGQISLMVSIWKTTATPIIFQPWTFVTFLGTSAPVLSINNMEHEQRTFRARKGMEESHFTVSEALDDGGSSVMSIKEKVI